MRKQLTILENAILNKLLAGDLPELIQLRSQLRCCNIVRREFTGCGFYIEFKVSNSDLCIPFLDIQLGDVIAEIEGLEHGAGFLLFIKNGVLSMLEGYSYDEPWPSSIDNFKLMYTNGEERNLKNLANKFKGN